MLYCTFRRCVHKLYAITLTMIGEVKTEPRVFSVCDVCVTDSRSSPHSGTAGQSKRSQVEPLVQKENFLPRYYRRRARRLACSNQTVSPPCPAPSCDVDADLLSDCSEYTSYMPSRRIPPTALFSFLSFSLVVFTFSKHFLFLSLFLKIFLFIVASFRFCCI